MYEEKKYSDAEVNYRKGLQTTKDLKFGKFNLGDALYRQDKYDDAIKEFSDLSMDKKLEKKDRASAYHNLGNAWLKSKKYEESIKAYKGAMKLNPLDSDTRYNLAYAQAMLRKEEQQKQKQQNKQGDNKEDQKKEGDKNKKQPGKKEDQQKAQPQKISKEDAEKILKALHDDEKNMQKKMQKKDAKKVVIDKNW